MKWWLRVIPYYHPKNPFYNLTAVLLGCNFGLLADGGVWGIAIGAAAFGALGIVMARILSGLMPQGESVKFFRPGNIFIWFAAAMAAILYLQMIQR
jgi:hypothetical protein